MAEAVGERPLVRYEVEDGVAVITIDNPPVNALGPGVRDGIIAALKQGEADPNVKARARLLSFALVSARIKLAGIHGF